MKCSATTEGLSVLQVSCPCEVDSQYNEVGEKFCFYFTDAGRSRLVYGKAGRVSLEARVDTTPGAACGAYYQISRSHSEEEKVILIIFR